MKKKKLFILLFMAGLVLPNLLFFLLGDRVDTSNNENRELAEFPKVTAKKLEDFPAGFEAFYNDHVPFKNYFVRLNYFLDTKVFLTTRKGDVTIGEDNWLFYTPSREGEDAMADYRKTNGYTEEKCGEIAEKIQKAEAYIKGKGVENFHYYVAPSKETLYPQFMPESVRVTEEGASRMEGFASYMKENSGASFTYLYPELKEYAEKAQIYYKYDTHMNLLGAFLMSQEMAEDFTGNRLALKDVKVKKRGGYTGDLARMLNQTDTMTDDKERVIRGYYPDIEYDMIEERTENGEEIFREYVSDSGNDRTLLVIGDSYRLKLEAFLRKLYKHSVFVRIDDFTSDMLEKYKPEDVAVITVERNQKYMENLDFYLGM